MNGAAYYYEKNLQGDVVGIWHQNGVKIANYTYDAWGNILSITNQYGEDVRHLPRHQGNLNPIRYRGYYYDVELKMYWLSTRLYDPEIGRFVNADDAAVLTQDQNSQLQYNLYAYCLNNPVNMSDIEGEAAANIIGGIVGGATGAVLGTLLAKTLGLTGWKKWALISAATVGGAVLGAFLGPYVAKLAKSIGSAAKSWVKSLSKTTSKAVAKSANVCKPACFVAGTLIYTETGHRPIEQIEAGDYVFAENPETGEKGLKQVVQTFVSESPELVHVFVNGEEIVTTPTHPFYVPQQGWTDAVQLRAGDTLVLANGEYVLVELVQHEILETPVVVYNFEVEDFHTYYVTDDSILVHNANCVPKFAKKSASQIEKMLKVKSGTFHRAIKPDILKSVEKDILKKVGSNPDILISQDGTIQLVSTVKKGVNKILELNIFDFVP